MVRNATLASLISLIITTPAWANGFITMPLWTHGFYAGIGLGPIAAEFNKNSSIIARNNNGVIQENISDGELFSGTGFFGTLFGGYQWNCRQFYLAGEINGDFTSVDFKSHNDEYVHGTFSSTDFKIKNSFGISVLPGYLYTPCTLFYGRLGYANGNFTVETTDTSLANISRNLSGFRFGLGVKESFTPHLAARMEYSQIMYQQTQFTTVTEVTKTTRITPTTGQVEFGLIYEC